MKCKTKRPLTRASGKRYVNTPEHIQKIKQIYKNGVPEYKLNAFVSDIVKNIMQDKKCEEN